MKKTKYVCYLYDESIIKIYFVSIDEYEYWKEIYFIKNMYDLDEYFFK